ncbi:MAG: TIR domain-containing protein, partial [Ktedonobacteraceae bacterium]|nr:TIR domain-containing protein [Ktedonobacteraceae bacterium]
MEEPFQLFCCYARSDQQYLAELKKHLKPLQREKLIDIKADIDIDPGMEWERKIHHYLEQSQIILLLISPDFIASNYCYNIEMHKALIRHQQGTACIIPIIIRPVDWQGTPVGTLQALPQDAKPVSSWSNSDEAYTSIARGIRTIVQKSAFFPHDTINRRINISIPLPGKVQDWRLTPRETSYRAQTIAANRFLWVDGFLENALQSGIFLQLQLQSIPSLVSHEREQLVQELQSVFPSTPTSFTGLLEVYDQTAGAVLLLGEPGSGKTILLLGLLRDLLTRAEHDSAVPLPALLPLTTWEQQCLKEQQSLEKWMIAELYRWYNLPARLSERWIKAGLLVPLLDGLDEMSENARADCIMAINDYCRSYGLTSPLV